MLDRTKVVDGVDSYYVFVKAGDAQGAQPETRAVVALPATTNKPAIVLKLHGHFGWVPVDLLSWETQTAGLVNDPSSSFRNLAT